MSERDEFERWCHEGGAIPKYELGRKGDGYMLLFTQMAYRAFKGGKQARADLAAERERELMEALESAVKAAEYVIEICEADVRAGEDPSPHRKSAPSATLAHAYMAMNFVGEAREALAKARDGQGGDK